MKNIYITFDRFVQACENTSSQIMVRFYGDKYITTEKGYMSIKDFRKAYNIDSISDFKIISFFIDNEYIYLDVKY